jgi:HAMP domain-containing protein
MNRELYHKALGAFYEAIKHMNGGYFTITEIMRLEKTFQRMVEELDKRGLEIGEKK